MRNTLRNHQWPQHIQRFTTRRVLYGIPAVFLGFILNLLDLVSTGMLVFPLGPHSAFNDALPFSLAIYLTSIITSQLALTLGGSGFSGAFGSMLVEILPLLRKVAEDIQRQLGHDSKSTVPTTLAAYSLCSLLIGGVFAVLGIFRCGFLVGYFPSTVLNGIVGSIGVDLLIISLELTLPTSSPNLEWATAGEVLFNARQLPLLFATIGPALLLSTSTRLEIFSKLTLGFTRNPLYIPLFMVTLAALFWTGAAATGRAHRGALEGLADDGWLFAVTGRGNLSFSQVLDMADYWRLFDFSIVQWSAFRGAAKNIALVVVIGVLNLPIAISALRQGLGAPKLDINRELFGNAAGNILAGAIGSVPNLIVFSYSRLFTEAGGGRFETFIVTLLTTLLFFLGPVILPYVPTILASVLVLYLGIDLVLEATWESSKTLQWPEFLVTLGTLLASTFLGFSIGLGIGVGLAVVVHCSYSTVDSAAKAVLDTKIRTQPLSILGFHVIAESSGTQSQSSNPTVQVLQMSGYSFFATIPSLEQRLDSAAARGVVTKRQAIIIDLSNAHRIETCVGQLMKQKFNQFSNSSQGIEVALAGIAPNSGVHADLERVGLHCRFVYEIFEDSLGSAPLSGDNVPAFRTLREANAWWDELSNSKSKPMTDDDVLETFEVLCKSSSWLFRTEPLREFRILRGIKGETLDLSLDGYISIVIYGRLAIGTRFDAYDKIASPVSRSSVATSITYLARRLFHRTKESFAQLADESDEENSMIPLSCTSDYLKRDRVLIPGDAFIHLAQLFSNAPPKVVIQSGLCAVIQLNISK